MAAHADDAPAVHHENGVRGHDRRHALGDDDGRGLTVAGAQGMAQLPVGAEVEGGGAVVQQQDAGIARQRPADEHPLLLAAGEVAALHVQRESEAALLVVDEAGLGALDGLQHAFFGHVAAEADVLPDGVGHQEVVLEHHAEAAVQLVLGEGGNGPAVQQDVALVGVVLAHQQRQQRRLARARGPDDAQRLPVPDGEGQVRHVGRGLIIGEGHALKGDVGGFVLRGRVGLREILGHQQNGLDAAGGGGALGVHDEQARDHQQSVEDDGEVAQERHDGARQRQSGRHPVRAHQHHGGEAHVEHEVGQRAHHGHGQVGGALGVGKVLVDLAEGVPLMLRPG